MKISLLKELRIDLEPGAINISLLTERRLKSPILHSDLNLEVCLN